MSDLLRQDSRHSLSVQQESPKKAMKESQKKRKKKKDDPLTETPRGKRCEKARDLGSWAMPMAVVCCC